MSDDESANGEEEKEEKTGRNSDDDHRVAGRGLTGGVGRCPLGLPGENQLRGTVGPIDVGRQDRHQSRAMNAATSRGCASCVMISTADADAPGVNRAWKRDPIAVSSH